MKIGDMEVHNYNIELKDMPDIETLLENLRTTKTQWHILKMDVSTDEHKKIIRVISKIHNWKKKHKIPVVYKINNSELTNGFVTFWVRRK